MKTLRTDRRNRRHDLRENGIRHDADTIDFQQHARVSEPDGPERTRCRSFERSPGNRDHGDLELRLANLSLPIEPPRLQQRRIRILRRSIFKSSADELRRAAHALETRALESPAELRQLKDKIDGHRQHDDGHGAELQYFLETHCSVIPSVARDLGGRGREGRSSSPLPPRSLATLGRTKRLLFAAMRLARRAALDADWRSPSGAL